MENIVEELKQGMMPPVCTLYHISTKELRILDKDFVATPHEGGKGFNLFCSKDDAILFGKQTGRSVLNRYQFNSRYLMDGWLNEADAVSLTNMFLIADDDYLDELKYNENRQYLADIRGCDFICGIMLTKALDGLKKKWNDCEMPIEQCVKRIKELPLTYIVTLKTADAFDRLRFEKSEEI